MVDTVLSQIKAPIGGFRTGFGPDRGAVCRSLYLWPAWEAPQWDEPHTVARFDVRGAHPLPRRFDTVGCAALSRAGAALLVMDECGRLEKDASLFQRTILAALSGPVPILGVVRQGLPGWTGAIAAHPQTELLTVTEENRDTLPGLILARLGH